MPLRTSTETLSQNGYGTFSDCITLNYLSTVFIVLGAVGVLRDLQEFTLREGDTCREGHHLRILRDFCVYVLGGGVTELDGVC